MSRCERRALLLPHRSCSPRLQADWDGDGGGAEMFTVFILPQLIPSHRPPSNHLINLYRERILASSVAFFLFCLCLNNARANGKIRISSEKAIFFCVKTQQRRLWLQDDFVLPLCSSDKTSPHTRTEKLSTAASGRGNIFSLSLLALWNT